MKKKKKTLGAWRKMFSDSILHGFKMLCPEQFRRRDGAQWRTESHDSNMASVTTKADDKCPPEDWEYGDFMT